MQKILKFTTEFFEIKTYIWRMFKIKLFIKLCI